MIVSGIAMMFSTKQSQEILKRPMYVLDILNRVWTLTENCLVVYNDRQRNCVRIQ
jgi:hypothetical protein